jgi:hypothetical protein
MWEQNVDFATELLDKFVCDIEALVQTSDPLSPPLSKLESFFRLV